MKHGKLHTKTAAYNVVFYLNFYFRVQAIFGCFLSDRWLMLFWFVNKISLMGAFKVSSVILKYNEYKFASYKTYFFILICINMSFFIGNSAINEAQKCRYVDPTL